MVRHGRLGVLRSLGAWTVLAAASSPAAGASWEPWRPSPMSRSAPTMTYDAARGRIVLFGGHSLNVYYQSGYAHADTWELSAGGWSARATSAPLAGRHMAAMAGDASRGRVVVFGGKNSGGVPLGDGWEWDGAAWRPVATPPPALGPRYGAAMAYDATRGRIVLFGGASSTAFLADTWEYDGAQWTPGPAAPAALTPRLWHAAAFHRLRGRVVVFGGMDSVAGRRNDTWEYDGTAWTPGPAAPAALLPRTEHAMAYDDGRGVAVLMGGAIPGFATARDTWLLDAVGWSRAADLPAESRYAHAMAFDASRGRVIAFGGAPRTDGAASLDETWEWNGTSWTSAPGCIPAAMTRRYAAAMAYDERRGRTVLFGGGRPGGPLADTWEFDGDRFTPGAAAPPGLVGRENHAMVYDADRGLVIMAGGSDLSGSVRHADLWEYDGATWIRGTDLPTVRRGHAMAYDRGRRVTVMFGGQVGGLRNDTWEFDGTVWTPGPAAPAALLPRFRHGMAYDESRNRTVMAGGENPTRWFDDVWEYDGSAWTAGPSFPYGFAEMGFYYDPDARRIVALGGVCGVNCVASWTALYDGISWASGPGFTRLYGHAAAYDRAASRAVAFGGSAWWCCYGLESERTLWEVEAHAPRIVAGGGLAAPSPDVVTTLGLDGTVDRSFSAYGAGAWGVNVSTGDLDRALPEEIATGPGPGQNYGPTVRGFRSDGSPVPKVNFFAYATLRYGVNVAPADIDGDAYDELLTGPGPGEVFGPHVRGFNYDGLSVTAMAKVSFYAYATLRYGVNVSRGDVDRDANDEILTGTGPAPAFAPMVRGFDLVAGSVTDIAKIKFWAFSTLAWGVNPAGGDADGDGYQEIAAAPGPGPAATFPARAVAYDYDGTSVRPLPGFDVVAFPTIYGARPALAPLRRRAADLLIGPGPDPAAPWIVRTFRYDAAALAPLVPDVQVSGTRTYGVNVAAGRLGPAL